MGSFVDFTCLSRRDMRVDLRCCRTRMAEQVLHHSEVGTTVQQVCSEAVSQSVCMEIGVKSRLESIAFDDLLDAS